jgi:outer membrane protein OmpA-like peptidoglycan-associated protein
MRDQILKSARTLAAFLPMLALAQPMAAQRERSWEFSGGVGAAYTDGALASFLGSNGFSDGGSNPSRFMPAVAVRLGYNVTEHWGVSIGTAGATATGVKYLTPFAAATYTINLNARFSPFLTGGTQFTRITGNGRIVHPTWGAHLGVGIRSMLDNRVALRLEGRMGIEHYADLPAAKTAYNSIITLGLSYFTTGHRAPPPPMAMAAAPCPVCALARVDTVWRTPPPAPLPPIVLRDTLVLEGINFAFDSSALTPESYAILDAVARALLAPEWANTRWQIAGHTSGIGTHEYNMALSQRRAETVRAYLVSRGVPNSRLTPVGFGEANPMYPNDSEGRNWRNRRVELRRMRP